jgi:hypothetical protein
VPSTEPAVPEPANVDKTAVLMFAAYTTLLLGDGMYPVLPVPSNTSIVGPPIEFANVDVWPLEMERRPPAVLPT